VARAAAVRPFTGRREKLDIDQPSLEHLVTGTHADIRQVLNLLSTFKLTASAMNYDQAKELYVGDVKRSCPPLPRSDARARCRCALGLPASR